MTLELPPSERIDMPAPSAELSLIGVLMRTFVDELPPKKRAAFMTRLYENFGEMQDMDKIVRIRPREYDDEVRRARRGALSWARAMLTAHFMMGAKR